MVFVKKNLLIASIASVLLSQLALADSSASLEQEKFGFGYYEKNRVKQGDSVCEQLDSNGQELKCYFVNRFAFQLTKDNDNQGHLNVNTAGSDNQERAFTKAKIYNFITAIEPNFFDPNQQIVPYYLKIHWEGKKGVLGIELKGNHIIQGNINWNPETGRYEITIENIPDMMMLDFFMPSLDIAEIFGRNAGTESEILKIEVMDWFKNLIKSPLEDYLNTATALDGLDLEPSNIYVP